MAPLEDVGYRAPCRDTICTTTGLHCPWSGLISEGTGNHGEYWPQTRLLVPSQLPSLTHLCSDERLKKYQHTRFLMAEMTTYPCVTTRYRTATSTRVARDILMSFRRVCAASTMCRFRSSFRPFGAGIGAYPSLFRVKIPLMGASTEAGFMLTFDSNVGPKLQGRRLIEP